MLHYYAYNILCHLKTMLAAGSEFQKSCRVNRNSFDVSESSEYGLMDSMRQSHM